MAEFNLNVGLADDRSARQTDTASIRVGDNSLAKLIDLGSTVLEAGSQLAVEEQAGNVQEQVERINQESVDEVLGGREGSAVSTPLPPDLQTSVKRLTKFNSTAAGMQARKETKLRSLIASFPAYASDIRKLDASLDKNSAGSRAVKAVFKARKEAVDARNQFNQTFLDDGSVPKRLVSNADGTIDFDKLDAEVANREAAAKVLGTTTKRLAGLTEMDIKTSRDLHRSMNTLVPTEVNKNLALISSGDEAAFIQGVANLQRLELEMQRVVGARIDPLTDADTKKRIMSPLTDRMNVIKTSLGVDSFADLKFSEVTGERLKVLQTSNSLYESLLLSNSRKDTLFATAEIASQLPPGPAQDVMMTQIINALGAGVNYADSASSIVNKTIEDFNTHHGNTVMAMKGEKAISPVTEDDKKVSAKVGFRMATTDTSAYLRSADKDAKSVAGRIFNHGSTKVAEQTKDLITDPVKGESNRAAIGNMWAGANRAMQDLPPTEKMEAAKRYFETFALADRDNSLRNISRFNNSNTDFTISFESGKAVVQDNRSVAERRNSALTGGSVKMGEARGLAERINQNIETSKVHWDALPDTSSEGFEERYLMKKVREFLIPGDPEVEKSIAEETEEGFSFPSIKEIFAEVKESLEPEDTTTFEEERVLLESAENSAGIWGVNFQGKNDPLKKAEFVRDVQALAGKAPEEEGIRSAITSVLPAFSGDVAALDDAKFSELMYHIALHESDGGKFDRQKGDGPAQGWWQVEPATAKDLLTSAFIGPKAKKLLSVDVDAIKAMEGDEFKEFLRIPQNNAVFAFAKIARSMNK